MCATSMRIGLSYRLVKLRLIVNSTVLLLVCCYHQALQAQMNNFPLYSSGDYSGGSGDNTNATNTQLKLHAITGYVRVIHVSANTSISMAYNYETGKDVYFGEPADVGNVNNLKNQIDEFKALLKK